MKYAYLYALIPMFILCTSSKGQDTIRLPTATINAKTREIITSHVPYDVTRTIRQDKNGNIWIAAFDGIFQYDGKSFTNVTKNVSSARFFLF